MHADERCASIDAEIRARLELAKAAAREGADVAQRTFVKIVAHEIKPDGSPVTEADRAGERHLRALIKARFPRDGILGEEFGEEPGESGFRWVLDPIDGTVSIMRGVPLWGTMIGVEHRGECVLGVIELGGLDQRAWGAKGLGAWHQDGGAAPTRAALSRAETLAKALVCTTSYDYFRKADLADRYERLCAASGSTRGWSDCYAFVLLATGRVDAVVEPWMRRWDLVAPRAIIEAAGGVFAEFPIPGHEDASGCVVGNAALVPELLRIMRED